MKKNNNKIHVLQYDLSMWENYFIQKSFPKYRAGQLFKWLHQKNNYSLDLMSDISIEIKNCLIKDFDFSIIKPSNMKKSHLDETMKVLWTFSKNKKAESVWLEFENRNSICVSSQSGCSLNCSFCATGQMKFTGNLTTAEILTQFYETEKLSGKKANTVVFMGMGEPFYNYEEVVRAAHILNHVQGRHLSSRKITISTSGVLPFLKKYLDDKEPFGLALSVHFLDSKKREKYMSVEKNYPLEDIIKLIYQNLEIIKNNRLTIEYTMISGENMAERDAQMLASLAKKIKAKVNLIPLNTSFNNLKPPTEEEVQLFWDNLYKNHVAALNRGSVGNDISAACGMLAGK
ncbi:MAG: 23S rRNA (adenine(2503)-C(2))-methyltransferase RlmN [Spirochaetia bacterium]|nr:23S rRNA (adenine(2503)-C(2))-methyltransferase RlmN [Spirochaetia bacterium]